MLRIEHYVVITYLVCQASSLVSCSEITTGPDESRANSPSLHFSAITEQAGLHHFTHAHGGNGKFLMPEIMGSGAGFLDYDSDGWLDILLVGGGRLTHETIQDIPALTLFRNNGRSLSDPSLPPVFTDVTEDVGLDDIRAYGFGIAAADYDNDGDIDFLLTTLRENLLFQNERGTFREVGREAGIADLAVWSTSALFLDANRDGFLDLYITNYLDWSPEQDVPCIENGVRDYCNPLNYHGVEDSYYQNNGDGTFSNRSRDAGFWASSGLGRRKGLGVCELDYDNDGWSDLYVANDGEPNYLFRNNQDGTFTEIGVTSGVAFDQNGTPRAGMGVDAGVIDLTGSTSLLVGNFSNEMLGVWRYEGHNYFTDRASLSRIGFPTIPTLTFGLALLDVDLDTDLDLILANGHVMKHIAKRQLGITFEQHPQLFMNTGNGLFDEVQPTGNVLNNLMVARGLAKGDIDRDGDLDILITENNGPVHLWRNDITNNNFLRVRLKGNVSNADGLGARIQATLDSLTMVRRVRTGSSYLSHSETTVTFGLGTNEYVTSLEVQWPGGRTDRFERVQSNREVLLVEGSSSLVSIPLP